MENCLFVAKYMQEIVKHFIFSPSLPQSLNNYELTIALYLVFSRYGKVVVVKASRDSAHRPFGFIEFQDSASCREALADNDRNGGIIVGGRKIRLEFARNTSKLYIKLPDGQSRDCIPQLSKFKPIPIANENAVLIKLDGAIDQCIIDELAAAHPDWIIQLRSDQFMNGSAACSVAESAQRQSGLFQLRIPESGVLPVTPSTLTKIHSYSPCLQYTLSALTPISEPLVHTPVLMSRLFEDWHLPSDEEESFSDPAEARAAAQRLTPPLGEWEGDVFIGRLDNQKVTLKLLLGFALKYGQVSFIRLCNRSIVREDRVPVDSTAFIRFLDANSAKACIEAENGATWTGRIIKCEKCWNFLGRSTPPISLETEKRSQ